MNSKNLGRYRFGIAIAFILLITTGEVMSEPINRKVACVIERLAERYVVVHFPEFDTMKYPPKVFDEGTRWRVEYVFPQDMVGGTPIIFIDKKSLKVIDAYHTQ